VFFFFLPATELSLCLQYLFLHLLTVFAVKGLTVFDLLLSFINTYKSVDLIFFF